LLCSLQLWTISHVEETDMPRTRQISQAIAGVAIAALGVTGLAATWSPTSATAQSEADSHETMHAMMSAMHGDEAVARMHQVEGAEEMMDECAGMMGSMGNMSNMMNGRGMSNMMDGPGTSNMMNGMMGR
jgi:hypothetical protein